MNRSGYTLIEAMCAAGILAIASLMMMVTFMSGSKLNDLTELESRAVDAIRVKMAEAKAKTHDESGSLYKGLTYVEIDGMLAMYYADPTKLEFDVDGLESPNGSKVGSIILYLNEAKVPAEFGDDDWGAAAYTDTDGYSYVKRKLNDNDTVEDCSDNGGAGSWDVDLVPLEVRVTFKHHSNQVTIRRFQAIARMNLVY